MRENFYRRFGKRLFDVCGATLGLMLTAPALLLIALLVRVCLGFPVLFRQLRPGLGGQPIRIMKFRTMNNANNSAGVPLADADRLTRFGRFLRSTSLDELPELFNVLRGEMSLVGPRPLLMQYLSRYTPQQMRRHDIRPGITGWAQITGRNAHSWDERFTADLWYVDNLSFVLDLKILARTVTTVVSRQGISAEGHATIPEFMGSQR